MASGFDLKGFEAFTKAVVKGVNKIAPAGSKGTSSEPMLDLFEKISVRYLAFIRRRFNLYSRGGGDWKPLARSTMLARRHKTKRKGTRRYKEVIEHVLTHGKFAILKDTGTMFNALTFGKPGSLYKKIRHGVRVGFGGPAKHPKGEGKATIADIAGYHNTGEGNLPKRRIIVEPDASLHASLQRDLYKALNRVASKAERESWKQGP